MARRFSNLRLGSLVIAMAIAGLLWGMAHGASPIERGYDISIELRGLQEDLVVTDQSVDAVNVRVMGSRAALRNVSPLELSYPVDVSGSKPGRAEYEVESSIIDDQLPRGSQIVSRSPAQIELRFERRARKVVSVRADVEGEPAPGFLLGEVVLEPRRIWLSGARSQVLRLKEVVTEPIDVGGLEESLEREVGLYLSTGTVWVEDDQKVKVSIEVQPDPDAQLEEPVEVSG